MHDDGRPVVHVTQGTLANTDLSSLVRPALEGLSELDGHVVVSTGGTPVDAAGPLPANARVAEFLPYDALLPRLDALVTNGGYGTVLLALRHGVPVVVAPGDEDKPEVAARVRYTGVGIDLGTSRPTPAAVRQSVRAVLEQSSYRSRARALAEAVARYRSLDLIRSELEALTERGAG